MKPEAEIKNGLKYCEIFENDEFINSWDITDISDDYPFCNITLNPSTYHYDVCAVRYCTEYGNDIRDDKTLALRCELWAAVAIARALHIKKYPAKTQSYRAIAR